MPPSAVTGSRLWCASVHIHVHPNSKGTAHKPHKAIEQLLNWQICVRFQLKKKGHIHFYDEVTLYDGTPLTVSSSSAFPLGGHLTLCHASPHRHTWGCGEGVLDGQNCMHYFAITKPLPTLTQLQKPLQRVMKECFLVLLRYWLHVEGKKVRLVDTRLYHEFGGAVILQDTQVRDSSVAALAKVGRRASGCLQHMNCVLMCRVCVSVSRQRRSIDHSLPPLTPGYIDYAVALTQNVPLC